MKYWSFFVLMFCYSCSFSQNALNDSIHLNLMKSFIIKSEKINADIDTVFQIKPKSKRQYHMIEFIQRTTSSGNDFLDTRVLTDSILQNIYKNRRLIHFVCQISTQADSLFFCNVYEISHKMLKGYPSLFCNFKIIYVVNNNGEIKIFRIDKYYKM